MTVKNELKIIKGFKGKYAWLSNMYQFKLDDEDFVTSVESLFQASKALYLKDDLRDEPLYDVIAMANPYDARKMGRNIKNLDIAKWNKEKLVAMAAAVCVKFWKNEELYKKLTNISFSVYLIESNNWNDTYWGIYKGKGHNYLGKILMYFRDVFKYLNYDIATGIETGILPKEYNRIQDKRFIKYVMRNRIRNITEEYLDKHYPIPRLNMNIQMFAVKPKYNIQIKNLNKEWPKEPWQVRVDRASILGNSYKMKNKNDDKERDEVCDKYEQYFIEQIKKGNELFAKEFLRLIEIFKKYNKLELFCWCAPKRCHAETLKKYIEIYLNKNNDNNNNNCKENNSSCVVSSGETSTQEVLNNKKKEENNMKNKIINNLIMEDIEFIDLTPSMFKGNNYILNKYFHYKDHSLDRPYLPEITKEEYEAYVKNWNLKNEANRKYETATDYYKNMIKKQIVAKDLGIENYKRLSFKGYKGDSENFEFSNYADNQRWLFEEKYIEDMFDPDRNLKLNLDRKNSPYVIGDYKDELNEAWQFLTLCIRGRLVMLLNLENLVFTINNFIKNTDGLTLNCSNAQIEQLTNPIKNALKMLKDKELNAWIKQGNNDMTLYGINGNENTRKDYIETYQKILRAMLNIKPNESLEYFKDVFHYTNKYYPNLKDKYENIILRNEGLEIENLWDSQSADYDEDNEESIVDNPEYYENVLLNN